MICTADPFATKLGLLVHYHKPECFTEKLDCCVQGQGHSKISKCQVNVCSDDIFWKAEPFTTKLDMVMYHAKMIDLLFSRSRSLQELIWSNCDIFCCIFGTAYPLLPIYQTWFDSTLS